MELLYKNILVAVDGSREAEYALKKAVHIAKKHGAQLHLVHVIDSAPYRGIEMYDSKFAKSAIQYGEDLVNGYKKEVEADGLTNVAAIVQEGSPKVVIANDVAKETNADLIVCGATGMNAVERMFLGSVSERITRSAKCDVLVVRMPAE